MSRRKIVRPNAGSDKAPRGDSSLNPRIMAGVPMQSERERRKLREERELNKRIDWDWATEEIGKFRRVYLRDLAGEMGWSTGRLDTVIERLKRRLCR